MRSAAPRIRELLLATLALGIVGAAVFGWYVAHGGFYSDDWANAASYRLAASPRYWHALHAMEDSLGGRPVLAALLVLPHALFGVHPAPHIALAVSLVVLTTVAFYAFLRLAGLRVAEAAPIAVLALLFPWADAIELWPTAGINTVAVLLFFVGASLALIGLHAEARRAVTLHGAAVLCFVVGILTYEAAAAATILLGALYVPRTSRRRAVRLWAVDVVVALAALGYSLARTVDARHVGTFHERVADLGPTTRQALGLLSRAVVPTSNVGHVVRPAALLAVVLVVVLAVFGLRSGRVGPRWPLVGLAAAVGIGAAYFVFLGSFLHPLDAGTGTRTNVFARFAYAALVYALVWIAAHVLIRSRRAAALATLAVVAAIASGYTVWLARDESSWTHAADLQRVVLAKIAHLPALPHSSTIVTFGEPGSLRPDAPVFDSEADITGAVRLARHDGTLLAAPVYDRVTVTCAPRAIRIQLPGSRGTAVGAYPRLYFLAVPSGRTERVTSRAACADALRRFHPGPFLR